MAAFLKDSVKTPKEVGKSCFYFAIKWIESNNIVVVLFFAGKPATRLPPAPDVSSASSSNE